MSSPNRVRLGSVKFSFSPGLTPPTSLVDPTVYTVHFPEGSGEFTPNAKFLDVKAPSLGINYLVGSPVTEATPEYSVTYELFNDNLTALFLGGATPATDTEPTSITVASNFSFIGYGIMEWYENGDTSTPYRKHAGFTCQLVPDGALSRDPSKNSAPKLKIRILGVRGVYSATGS